MPTNKLWLEHTERAAWESVEALREKLAAAEKRIERLAPPTAGWQDLLAALDALREEPALEDKSYAELTRTLVERAERSRAHAQELESELTRERAKRSVLEPVARSVRFEHEELPESVLGDDDEYEAGPDAQFLRSLWRRYRAHVRETARASAEGLVLAIESEVDRLAELDESELSDAALSLAVLSMRLEREARKSR